MNLMNRPTGARDLALEAAAWAARLSDGLMSSDEQAEFQVWLDADPAHGLALEETIAAWRVVEHYAASSQMMTLREAALASARRTLRKRNARWSVRRWAGMSIAASVLVAMIGVLTWIMPRTYETGVGERRVVMLSDGSKMSMDADTVVKLRYTKKDRRFWLERGRARFEVAHQPLRPFSVTAANDVVVATGTAFSVELVQKQVRVILYEGHVAVLDRNHDSMRRRVAVGSHSLPADQLLRPGSELILSAIPRTRLAPIELAEVVPADPMRSLSWESGQLVFENEPLSFVVERMNRYAGKPLVVGDAAAAKVRVSGVFIAGDTRALVQGLTAAFGLKDRTEPDRITLYGGKLPKAGS